MELTKEQAITEHRKMWKWISRQIMKDWKEKCSIKTISNYKYIYIENNFENEYIHNNCFCCEYVNSEHYLNRCTCSCPLYWNDENTETSCTGGYYSSINKIFRKYIKYIIQDKYIICEEGARRLAKMAYKIAMLEERKDNV